MRFNDRQLVYLSSEKADFEGRLHYKKVWNNFPDSKGFKEKWFKLKSNILFYFKLNDTRQLCLKQPCGAFILENFSVQIESCEAPFAFSITFSDDTERRHLFAGRSEGDVCHWLSVLQVASCGHLRSRSAFLREKIKEKRKELASEEPSNSFLEVRRKLENYCQIPDLTSSTNLIEF